MKKNDEFKLKIIGEFINVNSDFTSFEELRITDYCHQWSGSAVPYIERINSYYGKILVLCNKIELLEHRTYIQGIIDQNNSWKEQEKKRDFRGYW